MNLKKLLSMGIILSVTTSALVGCSSSKEDAGAKDDASNPLKVTLVSDLGGINDESFNQSAWEGLKKAKDELGVDVQVIESKQTADYVPNVESAVDEGSDLVIGVGFQMEAAIKDAAINYPDTKFAIIDFEYGDEQPENVNSIMFKAEEAAYLAGLIASQKSETGTVGFIGGTKVPIIETFEYGYLAGAEAGGSSKVLRQYADTYADASKGKAIANQMYSNNADVIFCAAGSTGLGAIESAKENNKMAIGVDKDQNALAPENVITSAMKRVDTAVLNTINDLVNNKFKGGEVSVFGLAEDAVGIAPTTSKNVDPEILKLVEEHAEKIKKGEIKVPKTEDEYKKFKQQ
ncbi:BMP family lipoprotein [Romboutsia sp.]|uniref:BMP family lipoprotein n=1 Tax=Romboutsia sp. TaxID=1965302 RepID=UPI003F2AEB86